MSDVNIFLRSPRGNYSCSFYLPSGERIVKSTKEKNKKLAQERANQIRDLHSIEATGLPDVAGKLTKHFHEVLKRVDPQRGNVESVEQHLKEWLARKQKTISSSTYVSYRSIVANFLKFLGSRANAPLAVVSVKDIQGFADYRILRGVTPQTARHNIKILSEFFKKAVLIGIIEKNPVAIVDLPDVVPEKRQPFEASEIKALLDKGKGTEWETMVMLGAYLGCRMTDAAIMKWDHVDFGTGLISWVPEKGKRKRKEPLIVPMAQPLQEHLRELSKRKIESPSRFLCPEMAAKRHDENGELKTKKSSWLSRLFIKFMVTAGFEPVNTRDNGRAFHPKSFHSLRHSAATELYRQGVSSEDRMKILGQTTPAIHAGYTHQEPDDLRKPVSKFPDYRKAPADSASVLPKTRNKRGKK